MKKTNSESRAAANLSVSERVRAAILFLQDAGLQRLSVSRICRAAGVSRANLYAHHRDLVDEILKCSSASKPVRDIAAKQRRRQRQISLIARLRECEARYHALVIVSVEQQAEIAVLRAKLNAPQFGKEKTARARTKAS